MAYDRCIYIVCDVGNMWMGGVWLVVDVWMGDMWLVVDVWMGDVFVLNDLSSYCRLRLPKSAPLRCARRFASTLPADFAPGASFVFACGPLKPSTQTASKPARAFTFSRTI